MWRLPPETGEPIPERLLILKDNENMINYPLKPKGQAMIKNSKISNKAVIPPENKGDGFAFIATSELTIATTAGRDYPLVFGQVLISPDPITGEGVTLPVPCQSFALSLPASDGGLHPHEDGIGHQWMIEEGDFAALMIYLPFGRVINFEAEKTRFFKDSKKQFVSGIYLPSGEHKAKPLMSLSAIGYPDSDCRVIMFLKG